MALTVNEIDIRRKNSTYVPAGSQKIYRRKECYLTSAGEKGGKNTAGDGSAYKILREASEKLLGKRK